MVDAAPNRRPTSSDIVNAYRLALGRDPETPAVIKEKVEHAGPDWLTGFFTSSEFRKNIRDTVLRGMLPTGSAFGVPPQAGLISWAADQLPLDHKTREEVRGLTEWPDLFRAIFADEVFSSTVLGLERGTRDMPFVSALEHLVAVSTLKGAIEFTSTSEVKGWALDTRHPDRKLAVELRFGGTFAGAVVPTLFRRDLQERFGGNGEYGFELHIPTGAFGDHTTSGELRDVASRAPLATVQLPPSPAASTELVIAVRRELDGLRAAIARVEARLPTLNSAVTFSLERYAEYFETYYGPRQAAVPIAVRNVDLAVLITAYNGELRFLDRILLSLERQSARPNEVIVIYDHPDTRIEVDYLLARYRARLGAETTLRAVNLGNWAGGEIEGAARSCVSPYLIVLREPAILAPNTCAVIADRFGEDADLLFTDDDCLKFDEYNGRERHIDPRLRSCWDRNLFYQLDFLGPLIAVKRKWVDLASGLRRQGEEIDNIVINIIEDGQETGIVHMPQVLVHRLVDAGGIEKPREREAALDGHLRRSESVVTVELHSDPLGARYPGALRLRYPIDPAKRATVVIPSRDRPDLLGPCLASLSASRSGSGIELDVIVVDNQSANPPSLDFLKQFSELDIRLIGHDGSFNWALINNVAAEQTNADVIIFLNDDTVVLSSGSIDELCCQALRAEVGAVGARLLYEDGTIQHAGMVMDPWHSFASHEGVGAPANDPGYLGRHTLVRQVATVTGACLATRLSLFKETGGFDVVNFPVEGNDTDYCLRLRSLGYQIIYTPYAAFYHFESKSRGFNINDVKRERALRATQVLRNRWAERFEKDAFYNPHFDRLSRPFSRLQPPDL